MAIVHTDMIGREVRLGAVPKRIVSLVPSQTELLFDLGLDEEVVGITKFCVHPESWFRSKRHVGGTKTVNLDVVRTLRPDLIIANKEENTKEQVEALADEYPVWTSDIKNLADALTMIRGVGEITGTESAASAIAQKIETGFAGLASSVVPQNVAYYIWRNPWMCAGADTFITDIINRMGWTNVVSEPRYPEVLPSVLAGKGVERVLLSSEPYPFKDKHIAEINEMLPGVGVTLVDGEMFSWYGSRLLHASGYLSGLLR